MAFTEQDRTYIRRYLGVGALFLQAFPLIESAITAAQAVTDPGGTRPDSSTENEIKGLIYGQAAVTGTSGIAPTGVAQDTSTVARPAVRGLLQVDALIAQQDAFVGTMEAVGDAKFDPYREMIRLRNEGRRLCKRIAKHLGMRRVLSDVFSPGSTSDIDDAGQDLFVDERYW